MKKPSSVLQIYIVFLILMILETIIALFVNKTIFFVLASITVLAFIVCTILLLRANKKLFNIITGASNEIANESRTLIKLKIPIIISSYEGKIIWYNNAFTKVVENPDQVLGNTMENIVGPECMEQLISFGYAEINMSDKIFSAYCAPAGKTIEEMTVYYLVDETVHKKTVFEYTQSRPVVAILAIDNIEEVTKGAKDSERASFKGAIETEIEKWSANKNAISRKLSGDRYLIVLEERYFNKLLEEKFSVLKLVRQIKFSDMNATLSIGIGRGAKTFSECEELAVQALDMALGRGGDQVAIKMPNNQYKFFGGVSTSIEKRTKVRARMVATALKELVMSSENVIIMGHRYTDLDCFGASFGLYSAIKAMDKDVYIVMNEKDSLALPLVQRIRNMNEECSISDGNDILSLITDKTLLIITDVHIKDFLENIDVYNACKNVVVIDHHLKSVDFIDNSVIFFNETSASSTCEMVTELLQYFGSKSVGQLQAEALLSGIMLDTRNFIMHTGVRTFEASAFLRNRGADPTTVSKLFSGSMTLYKQRANIVASAVLYDDCAIAEGEEIDNDTRIACAQAADELLGINGVKASFVLSKMGHEVKISARSLGVINVQLIMEDLGGGGHRTMAAAVLKTDNLNDAKKKLVLSIDNYKKTVLTEQSEKQ